MGHSIIIQAGASISGSTDINVEATLVAMFNSQLAAMGIGELIGLGLETMVAGMGMKIISVLVTVILYGRMVEIYLYISVAPVPFSTWTNSFNFSLNKLYNFLNNKVDIKYEYLNVSKIIVKLDEKKCIIYVPNGQVIDDELYKKIEIKLYNELKDIAVRYISQAMEKYIKMTSLTPKEIQVRRFKSIWGNCSSKKVIKINEKIIHYGIKQIEYVCLHEITHLKYMNHKKEFWSHIKKYMPEYKEAVKELK